MRLYEVNYKLGVDQGRKTVYILADNELDAINKAQDKEHWYRIHDIRAREFETTRKKYVTENSLLWFALGAMALANIIRILVSVL